MYDYDIQYNGETARSHGVAVSERPAVPVPVPRYEEFDIAGRDGTARVFDGTYDEIAIEVSMNFVIPRGEWMDRLRDVKLWLLGEGDRRLYLSDDSEMFYKVKLVQLESVERLIWRVGQFTATFLCDPYTYLELGRLTYQKEDVLYNPYLTSHPTYTIKGEGMCTLTVNGNAMTANVGQNMTIDTDRMICYREDGTIENTKVSGDYEAMYLLAGQNTITVSPNFELGITPNWRML